MSFKFGARSLKNLVGVHPDLVKVVHRALEISTIDFTVLEGLRTHDREAVLVSEGKSQTTNSRHLTGHAIDLGAWVDNKITWQYSCYITIALAMKKASRELSIPVEWGGDWKTLKDGGHFQLPWKTYPVTIILAKA